MAGVIQTTLETALRLTGAQQYIRYLNQATQAHREFTREQTKLRREREELLKDIPPNLRAEAEGQLGPLGGAGLAGLAGGIATAAGLAAIAALTEGVKASVQTFSDYDRALIRTQVTLQNMGTNLPTEQIQAFAREVSLSTGITQTELVNLQGYLARFGTSAAEIERATRVIANVSRTYGKSVEEVGRILESNRFGTAHQLFSQLGIPVRNVTGYLGDFNSEIDILDRHTKGITAAFQGTLPNAFDLSSGAVNNLKQQLGQLFAPATTAILNSFTQQVNDLAVLLGALGRTFHIPGAGARGAVQSGISGAVAHPRSEDYLRRIEQNTGPQGPLGRALRGGGSYGEAGGGLRIRDFNQMMRHTG